jgi:hypothetical protein
MLMSFGFEWCKVYNALVDDACSDADIDAHFVNDDAANDAANTNDVHIKMLNVARHLAFALEDARFVVHDILIILYMPLILKHFFIHTECSMLK